MPRDFIRELREADRKVLVRLRIEDQAREAYARVQETVTAGIPHAHDEDARLQILTDARHHYVEQHLATDRAIDTRTQLLDDRMQDHIVRLVRTTGLSLQERST
jgi:hypothetical protein